MTPKPFARDLNAHKILFDPSDKKPDFIGVNESNLATTTTADWDIWRFQYATATSNVVQIRRARGIFDDRATLLP